MSTGFTPATLPAASAEDPTDDFNFQSPPPDAASLAPASEPSPQISEPAPQRQPLPAAFSEESSNRQGAAVAGPSGQVGQPITGQPGQVPGTSADSGDVVFPPELLRDAALTPEQAKQQFSSPDELRRAVDLINARLLRTALDQRQAAAMQQQQFRPPMPNVAPQFPVQGGVPQQVPPNQAVPQQMPPGSAQAHQPASGVPGADGGLPRFDLKLDPNQYDAEIVQTLTGLNDHYHRIGMEQQRQLETITNVMRQSLQYQVARQQEAYYDEFDRVLNGMEQYREIVGEGNRHTLDPASTHFQARRQIEDGVRLLNQQRQQYGMRPLPLSEAVQSAIRFGFPEAHDTTVRNQVASAVQRRQGQFTQPPSGRRATPPTGESAAIQRVQEILARHSPAGNEAGGADEF